MNINNSHFNNGYQTQEKCENGILNTSSSLETKLTTTSITTSSPEQLLLSSSNLSMNKCSSDKNDGNFNSDLNENSAIQTQTGFKCDNTSSGSNSNGGNNNSNEFYLKEQQSQHIEPNISVSINSSSSSSNVNEKFNLSSPTTSQEQLQLQHQQSSSQLHSKRDSVRLSGLPLNTLCNNNVSSLSTAINTNSSNNTSYIKNPAIGMVSLNKANKYKISSAKLNSPSSNGNALNSFQTKKMVAKQQTDVNEESSGINLDFDPSEELQYGPGIVSKLRCRYLSLALRQSTGKQRPQLDNLRRATSLNNLLDDDDDSNNGSVVDQVVENNTRNAGNTCSTSATTPDEFIANFQKNFKISEKDKQRSRQLKRGNDSMKRARSVEALLSCDKSWDSKSINNNETKQLYHKIENCNNSQESCFTHTSNEITIEDKINNARERILGEKTPKRLTPIIDDTERPPPDVVKQTLKIFEATANRRGRGLSRSNCSGEVAAKVASYKSIISQEKPPIVFPKPPLSPKRHFKKSGHTDISSTKRNVNSNTNNISNKKLPAIPISNLSKKFTNIDSSNESCDKSIITDHSNRYNQQSVGTISTSPCGTKGQITEVNLRHRNNFIMKNESTPIRSSFNSNGNNSPHTPDLIPRKHFEHSLFAEALSPVTQLTKNFEQMKIEPQLTIVTAVTTTTTATVVSTTNSTTVADSGVKVQKKNIDFNDELLNTDQISIQTVPKNNLSKREINQENNLNKFSSSTVTSSAPSVGKPLLPIALNRNPLLSTSSNSTSAISGEQSVGSVKQICIIRPLLAETKTHLKTEKLNSTDKTEKAEKSTDYSDALNRNKINNNLGITNTNNCTNLNNSKESSEYIQLQQQQKYHRPILTSQEIEKNLINEKKNEEAAIEASVGGAKWPFMKKKSTWGQQIAEAQNNSMVFNFKDRKDVPDYIENDGLLVKRRRELPKPNEPGFVLLGDLTVETSTDGDDSWTMGPPSPCDVEFENANIIIDGKSSIQYKPKDISLKVQFNDMLTSTFEYPSESSFIEDSKLVEAISNESVSSHHVKCDEIITPSGQKLLGNVSIGSAPLSNYTPIKAQICTTFELGVTRAPTPNDGCDATATKNLITSPACGNTSNNENTDLSDNPSSLLIQLNGDKNSLSSIKNNYTATNNEPYLKPATEDLTIVYSEGSQKTDLLY